MDFLWDKITEWLKEMLIGGIVSNHLKAVPLQNDRSGTWP